MEMLEKSTMLFNAERNLSIPKNRYVNIYGRVFNLDGGKITEKESGLEWGTYKSNNGNYALSFTFGFPNKQMTFSESDKVISLNQGVPVYEINGTLNNELKTDKIGYEYLFNPQEMAWQELIRFKKRHNYTLTTDEIRRYEISVKGSYGTEALQFDGF